MKKLLIPLISFTIAFVLFVSCRKNEKILDVENEFSVKSIFKITEKLALNNDLKKELKFEKTQDSKIGELHILKIPFGNNESKKLLIIIKGVEIESKIIVYNQSLVKSESKNEIVLYSLKEIKEMTIIRDKNKIKKVFFTPECTTCSFGTGSGGGVDYTFTNWCLYLPILCNIGGGGGLNDVQVESILSDDGGSLGGFYVGLLAMNNSVSSILNLSPTQSAYLASKPGFLIQINNSLQSWSTDQDKKNYKEHIDELMNNSTYYSFAINHWITTIINTSQSGVWWRDNNWIDDPNNFNLDIDAENGQAPYDKLTAAEKLLAVVHPINAARINANVSTAYSFTDQIMGTGAALNNKKDAFRHTFFNAINARDCSGDPASFSSNTDIVRLFGVAHESEVPTVLALEKQMDLFNNDVGIAHCAWCVNGFNTSQSIADNLKIKLDNGIMKYLKDLNFNLSPYYDGNKDGIQDCTTCLNGITNSTTLVFTNQ